MKNKRSEFHRCDKISSVKERLVMLCEAHVAMQLRSERAIRRECEWLLVNAVNPFTIN
jgi:hypothetical protein